MLTDDEGVMATLLVQHGTLSRGDVILCGAAYGRVRAMYDDLGRPIEEAGPSVPVRITGLDEVPNADDPFYVVADLAEAREIAEKRERKLQRGRRPSARPDLDASRRSSEAKIAELKVILKADVRGSVEAIRKELEKLHHEEVRVRVLHAGIGAITESDVQLALTSPEDTIIVGFNVVPDDAALALAEEKRRPDPRVRHHLQPDRRHPGGPGRQAQAARGGHPPGPGRRPRDVQDQPRRHHRRLLRHAGHDRAHRPRSASSATAWSIYPPADRIAGLESLKRFKDDVREVREGFECGIKIAGYDDVKVGDVIEAYRIEQVQRTLS